MNESQHQPGLPAEREARHLSVLFNELSTPSLK
jgi:hypothetical protein